jgi:hypothetical protein
MSADLHTKPFEQFLIEWQISIYNTGQGEWTAYRRVVIEPQSIRLEG